MGGSRSVTLNPGVSPGVPPLPSIRQFISLTASGQTGFPPAQSLNRSVTFPSNLLSGSTIIIFATQSNGGSPGGAISWTDSFSSTYGSPIKQIDDTTSPDWESLYAYAAYNVPGGACTLNATFAVLIWQGIFAIEVANCTAAPLINVIGAQPSGVGTGTDALSAGSLAAGSHPAIIIGATSNASDINGAPNAGTGYTTYQTDWNWGGAEGTPNLPSLNVEYKQSSNPGTGAVTWTAAAGPDNYNAIALALSN